MVLCVSSAILGSSLLRAISALLLAPGPPSGHAHPHRQDRACAHAPDSAIASGRGSDRIGSSSQQGTSTARWTRISMISANDMPAIAQCRATTTAASSCQMLVSIVVDTPAKASTRRPICRRTGRRWPSSGPRGRKYSSPAARQCRSGGQRPTAGRSSWEVQIGCVEHGGTPCRRDGIADQVSGVYCTLATFFPLLPCAFRRGGIFLGGSGNGSVLDTARA